VHGELYRVEDDVPNRSSFAYMHSFYQFFESWHCIIKFYVRLLNLPILLYWIQLIALLVY